VFVKGYGINHTPFIMHLYPSIHVNIISMLQIRLTTDKDGDCNMRNFSGILWGLVFITIGTVLLLDKLNYLEFNFGHFIRTWWPLVLVIIGLGMLFDKSHSKRDN
jgi:hypothetical protein